MPLPLCASTTDADAGSEVPSEVSSYNAWDVPEPDLFDYEDLDADEVSYCFFFLLLEVFIC